ncbi:hypothetical protein SLS58_000968 [Diplodia intermedia]|uniref:Uncharacterized protein n=1 Tax=Diplodia intermedia TaxID=856260 RepID=A0ABR3U4E1_9PEZI
MVVFLDFEDDSPDPFLEPYRPTDAYPPSQQQQQRSHAGPADDDAPSRPTTDERPNPNINGFSAILSCYPIVTQLASQLDLNSLHDLSRTCRQFRANLLEYRNQLVTQTLRCRNDDEDDEGKEQRPPPPPSDPHHAQHDWRSSPNEGRGGGGRLLLSGKVGRCARDMVGECRKCGVVVCRTCANVPLSILTSPDITSPPPACSLLSCRTAAAAGRSVRSTPGSSPHSSTSTLSSTPNSPPLFTPSSSPGAAEGSSSSIRHSHHNHNTDDDDDDDDDDVDDVDESSSPPQAPAFTSQAFIRSPCTCPDAVWLCGPCGHAIRTRDGQYSLGWTWRTRYSTYLGGLGAGIGEGHEGVKCGLGPACRGGHDVEHEECGTAEELAGIVGGRGAWVGGGGGASLVRTSHGVSIGGGGGGSSSNNNNNEGGGNAAVAGSPHDEWSGSSFFAQEIEGIGGRRVMKIKRRVRVGAVVKEYEDEREGRAPYLGREKEGLNRAWCAWCARAVPSRRDARELLEEAERRWGLGGGGRVVYCGDGRTVR